MKEKERTCFSSCSEPIQRTKAPANLPQASEQLLSAAVPCPATQWAAPAAEAVCKADPPAHSADALSQSSPGSASLSWAHCNTQPRDKVRKSALITTELSNRKRRGNRGECGPPRCSGLVPAEPVLDAFSDNEEVALDEALDDLTVPLLPRTQLAGNGHRLAKRGKVKCWRSAMYSPLSGLSSC